MKSAKEKTTEAKMIELISNKSKTAAFECTAENSVFTFNRIEKSIYM